MNVSRRNFLLGVAVTSLAGGCRSLPWKSRPKTAAQLYSIHKIFWKNPEKCLEALKLAGYDGVEFAGYNGRSAKELKKLLADAGLEGMGTHVNGFVDLKDENLRKTLDFCAEAGFDTVTTPHAICKTADEYRRFGHDMSQAAEAAVPYGIKVGIHSTYDHFRVKFGGICAWDVLFSEASPLLQQQVDTSNAFNVIGDGLLALLKKYRGRHYSVHLKENVPQVTGTLGERPKDGGRVVPWREVFDTLGEEGVAWYVVEAEAKPDSLRPLVDSLGFIERKIG